MSKADQTASQRQIFEGRAERERQHYNRLATRNGADDLTMPQWNIERYRNVPEDTEFPLEYAYHLLGDIIGKTVLDLGCGEGLNTTILAALGANVVAVDLSDECLELTYRRARANGVASRVRLMQSDAAGIPLQDGEADRVLCAAILHHVDFLQTARHIHRILKLGGLSVFEEPMTGPDWFCAVKKFLPKDPAATDDERPLSLQDVQAVSRAVGRHGRSRYFGVVARVATRFNPAEFATIRRFHRFDRWLLKTLPWAQAFASPLVWAAQKA